MLLEVCSGTSSAMQVKKAAGTADGAAAWQFAAALRTIVTGAPTNSSRGEWRRQQQQHVQQEEGIKAE